MVFEAGDVFAFFADGDATACMLRRVAGFSTGDAVTRWDDLLELRGIVIRYLDGAVDNQ